jgi:methionine synthase I (cobalamin-dependent)
MVAGGVLFDGAMGTMLMSRGLPAGRPPEEWNHERPEIVRSIHVSYLEAGADVIGTNTFGGAPARLRGFGLARSAADINTAAVRIAREAISSAALASSTNEPRSLDGRAIGPSKGARRCFVALSIGPSGKMLPPVGTATESEMREEFERQISGIVESFDLVVIETMYDVREALAALTAAKGLTPAPVAVTLTFAKNPRGFFTIMGDEPRASLGKLEDAGADVVGANCTLASEEMIELARILRATTDLPVLCQPNAGRPRLEGGKAVYDQSPGEFARDASILFELGVNAVGGCCGTTPEFISEIRKRINEG